MTHLNAAEEKGCRKGTIITYDYLYIYLERSAHP